MVRPAASRPAARGEGAVAGPPSIRGELAASYAARLTGAELRRRARQVRLVLTDCDGVLTDGGVYYSAEGEVMKRFSVRDGMGVERLRGVGVRTAIVSGDDSPSVRRRAEKLGLAGVHLGIKDKLGLLPQICAELGCRVEEVAGIGDDVNDLGLLRLLGASGLTAAPADAMPEVLREVQYRTAARGGAGAFREFAEWILLWRRAPEDLESGLFGREASKDLESGSVARAQVAADLDPALAPGTTDHATTETRREL